MAKNKQNFDERYTDEADEVVVELECAHDVSNSIYDAISKISLSKKSDIRAKNKEEKK